MKAIASAIEEAQIKRDKWRLIIFDEGAMRDHQKTTEDVIALMNYFDGLCDGLVEARYLMEQSNA